MTGDAKFPGELDTLKKLGGEIFLTGSRRKEGRARY
jgi:hypothetical protein